MAETTLHEECPTCGGDGMHPITKKAVSSFRARKCDDCGGTGRVDSPAALERPPEVLDKPTMMANCGHFVDCLISQTPYVTPTVPKAEHEAKVAQLEAERDELLAALEPVLVEIEPFRYEQRREIDRQVEAKQEWAKRHNAQCGNSNEMWFYSTEFRRALEGHIQPLTDAVSKANEVFDRITASKASGEGG